MIKKLTPFLSKYGLYTILCPLAIIAEVLLEIRIPLLMAKIVDIGIQNRDIRYITQIGITMVVMALAALFFGAIAAIFSARASMGFGSNLRKGLFHKVQEFSFSNIDRFSTPSLITRLTTDVNNVQNAFCGFLHRLNRYKFITSVEIVSAGEDVRARKSHK